MTTWTCKGPIAALLLFALTACEDGQGAALFEGLSVPPATGRTTKPILQAKLSEGAVILVAPPGFCIDRKSVRKRFALMARCDILGAPQAAGDAPLAFITVSIQPASPDASLPAVEHLAAASALSAVSDPQIRNGQLTFRAKGAAPIDGVSNTHWRGTTRIGTQIVGVALYGPEKGRAITGEGRSIVSAVLSRSQIGS
ncbi:hypothetical protein [Sulfitobacter sp. SK011]|uniref:hypothetical protein n=1 Tax=Sulfitobacter sp. SK011 TaxID=1389004 RepID=UPI000E0BD776|nr:hypothetical protein [Sulfitobacter sp. SK011]AXI40886.1 hypothetical protein C1J02_02135 [Sulfitobacter sp. SK011]